MSYVVRVKGYNSYWSGVTEPGKFWTEDLYDAKKFETKEEGDEVVKSGNNMECVLFDDAISDPGSTIPDWNKIEVGVIEARKRMKPKGFAPEKPDTKKPENVEEIDLVEDDFIEL